MNTSAIKEEQQDLISILTTELEKENKESISILTTELDQKRAALKEVQSIPTKIYRALDTLVPITTQYPQFKEAIASPLGLMLPPSEKSIELITELTSTFPDGWKYNESLSTWGIALTEKEVTRITQNTDKTTGTIKLKEILYRWNLETFTDFGITVLTLQPESNPDTTATTKTNEQTDSEIAENVGKVLALRTSDTPKTEQPRSILVEKLEELAKLAPTHNLTININTNELAGYVLAPHPKTEKLHTVINFNISELPQSGWLWQYSIHVKNKTYQDINCTLPTADFAEVLQKGAEYYFEEPLQTLITKLTENYQRDWAYSQNPSSRPSDYQAEWVHNETSDRWEKKLTEKESQELEKTTNTFSGTIPLFCGYRQWSFDTQSKTFTLEEETDRTYVDESEEAPTLPTKDTVGDKDTPNKPTVTWYNSSSGKVELGSTTGVFYAQDEFSSSDIDDFANILKGFEEAKDTKETLPTTSNTTKNTDTTPIITWYNHTSGEIALGSKTKYFRAFVKMKFIEGQGTIDEGQYTIRFKESTDSKKWIEQESPDIFTKAIIAELKAEKNLQTDAILQNLKNAAEEIGGMLLECAGDRVGELGEFRIPSEGEGCSERITIGGKKGNWWFIRPGRKKVCCGGDVTAFARILKGLAAETVEGVTETVPTTKNTAGIVEDVTVTSTTAADTTENKDTMVTVDWYNGESGEVREGKLRRYFQLRWNTVTEEYEIRFKVAHHENPDSGNWTKPSRATESLTDAVWQEFKAGKAEATKAFLQVLHDAASEVGGRVQERTGWRVGSFGHFLFPNSRGYNDSVEIGYNDSSWWFFRLGTDRVYCDGDVTAFAKILKGLAAEAVEGVTEESTTKETTDSQGKASDRKYTPPEITQLILAVLGEIDLDPAADDGKHISAKTHYTIADNGLKQEWYGKVFMNPPYSCSGEWVTKLNSEFLSGKVTEAIALLPASTDTKWFQPLWNQPICFWRGRITFLDENYEVLKSPARQSHCFIYWGENVEKFSQVFNKYGEVTLPTKTKQETLTLFRQIIPYLPAKWELEEDLPNQVIIRDKTHQDSHVTLTHCLNGEINITQKKELLYIVKSQDIETAIDLIYSWFEQQKSVKTQSLTNNNSSNQTESNVAVELPTEKAQKTLTFSEKIKPYLPKTWELEDNLGNNVVIIKEKTHPNNHVKLCNSTIGDIYIRDNQELLYTVHYQDIETAIDLINSWFEQQKSLTTPSLTNNNSSNQTESNVEFESPEKEQKLLKFSEKIQPILLETWELETINDNEVIIYETKDKNSDFVQITETSNSSTPFRLTHKGESYFTDNIADIKFALVSDNFTDINWEILSAKDGCNSAKSTESFQPKEEVNADSYELDIDYLNILIEIINNYDSDLTILRKDTSTAYIKVSRTTVGTIFYKDDKTIEIAEREKQLLTESYSIDIDNLIEDIYQEKVDKNKNNYLMGVGSLDAEFSNIDTLQNALHCLSNQLNLITIRQGKTFKVYNGKEWLENYLGSVVVNNSKIISDETLSYELLNNHSILLNQLTNDILKGETEIETDNYIITNETLKELLTKENWDNWDEQDFEIAQNLLKELVEFSPAWNQLLETIRLKRKELIEQTNDEDDDNPDNNGGSKTPPSTPNNPNNNGGIEPELNTKHLDTLETAINSYKTDLKMNKNCSNIAFYQGHSQLGSVTINQSKLLAESKLVSHLTIFYGIDIKGLIKSIKYNSKYPNHDIDPFAYIGSNNNAFKTLGCVVAPTWEKERERRGILQSVSGQIATIQWLDSGVPGDNDIGYVNINLLRYVSALPLTKSDSSQVSTVSVESENMDTDKQTECDSEEPTAESIASVSVESENMDTDKPTKCDSEEPTAESIASLNFGGLIAVQRTQLSSTIANTQLNTEKLPETESIINTLNNTVVEESPSNSSEITVVSECDNDQPTAESDVPPNLKTLTASQTNTSLPIAIDTPSDNNDNSSTVNWYDSSSGEVIVGGEHRFFHILSDNSNNANTYYIGLKKSETAKSWSKNINVTTKKFIDAVWKDVEKNPSKDTGGLVKELENAAAIVVGKFVSYTGSVCSLLGWFFADKEAEEKIANVGYYKNSWWYYSSTTQERTYFSGDTASLIQVLKGLATEESPSNDTTDNQTESDSNEPTAESMAVLEVQTPSEQLKTGKTLTINSQNRTINGKAISFGKTLTELLSGNKTVTRRFWKDNYAQRFINDWNAKPGEFLYPALTKGYHVGGKRVGYIRLTHKPYQEKLVDMPSSELAAEGFPKLSKQQFIGKFFEGDNQQIVWVIRFEFIPDKEYQKSSLSQQKKTQKSLEEELINKVEKQLSMIDKFQFKRTLGIPKITLYISLKDEILGRIFTDTHEGLVSDISLEKSLMERYDFDIKLLILDIVKGNQIEIENYRKKPENYRKKPESPTTTQGDIEIIKNTASAFFDEYDDPTWLNLIKAEIELLEDLKASHDEVNLTVTHYGTYIGNIHYNQDDELEIEQKLIGELAKYDLNLEAYLVAKNIPYKLSHPKPVVVTQNQTSENIKKFKPGSSNGKRPDSNVLNKNETELDKIYIQEPCTITKIRQILATVAPEICFTDDGINMVAWHDGKDLGNINVPELPLWITYSSNLEEYLKNHCRFNLSSLIEDIEKGNLNGLPFSDLIKELKNGNQNCQYFDSEKNNNLPVTSQNQGQAAIKLDLLNQLAAVFDTFDNIHTKRSETTLWFYRGDENLYPCLMETRDGETFTLFPTVKLKSNMKELFGIDIDKLCFDLETGKSVDINDYVDQSVWEQTIKNSHKNNETITWKNILNNAAINDTTDSQTKNELNASTTTEESNTDSYEHPEGLHWVKDTSMYNRSETYVVWNGSQKCGKIHICNKRKNKAGFGKWYVSTNVFGQYYDTIEKAATACCEDFISKNAEQTATEPEHTELEEELIPF